jgi:hypothetical protein
MHRWHFDNCKLSPSYREKFHSSTKFWCVTFPDNRIEIAFGLSSFCEKTRIYILLSSKLSVVESGKRKQHRGFVVKKITKQEAIDMSIELVLDHSWIV